MAMAAQRERNLPGNTFPHCPLNTAARTRAAWMRRHEGDDDGRRQVHLQDGHVWSATSEDTFHYTPLRIPPPRPPTTDATNQIMEPPDCFDLFVTGGMIQLIRKFTTLEGRRHGGKWKDISTMEMRALLGLQLLAGVCRSKKSQCVERGYGTPHISSQHVPGQISNDYLESEVLWPGEQGEKNQDHPHRPAMPPRCFSPKKVNLLLYFIWHPKKDVSLFKICYFWNIRHVLFQYDFFLTNERNCVFTRMHKGGKNRQKVCFFYKNWPLVSVYSFYWLNSNTVCVEALAKEKQCFCCCCCFCYISSVLKMCVFESLPCKQDICASAELIHFK